MKSPKKVKRREFRPTLIISLPRQWLYQSNPWQGDRPLPWPYCDTQWPAIWGDYGDCKDRGCRGLLFSTGENWLYKKDGSCTAYISPALLIWPLLIYPMAHHGEFFRANRNSPELNSRKFDLNSVKFGFLSVIQFTRIHWNYRNSPEFTGVHRVSTEFTGFTGIHRNPPESTGIHRNREFTGIHEFLFARKKWPCPFF